MHAIGKSAESGHIGSTAASKPLPNTLADMGSQPDIRKEKPIAKKRKGEAEKLLTDRKERPTRRALARQKEVVALQVMTFGASREQLVELEEDDDHEEPAPKRAGKRAHKGGSPEKKKKKAANAPKLQPLAAKVPSVRVSDSRRRKIIVLNVVGLICDIRPLHDRREWGSDPVIYHVKDLHVKIKKKTDCGKFLSMLCSNYDVGKWSPIEQTLLEIVVAFLAEGTTTHWSFLWGRSYPLQNPIRDLHNLFSMISDPTHSATRCLQFDCDATATARSPPQMS